MERKNNNNNSNSNVDCFSESYFVTNNVSLILFIIIKRKLLRGPITINNRRIKSLNVLPNSLTIPIFTYRFPITPCWYGNIKFLEDR